MFGCFFFEVPRLPDFSQWQTCHCSLLQLDLIVTNFDDITSVSDICVGGPLFRMFVCLFIYFETEFNLAQFDPKIAM